MKATCHHVRDALCTIHIFLCSRDNLRRLTVWASQDTVLNDLSSQDLKAHLVMTKLWLDNLKSQKVGSLYRAPSHLQCLVAIRPIMAHVVAILCQQLQAPLGSFTFSDGAIGAHCAHACLGTMWIKDQGQILQGPIWHMPSPTLDNVVSSTFSLAHPSLSMPKRCAAKVQSQGGALTSC